MGAGPACGYATLMQSSVLPRRPSRVQLANYAQRGRVGFESFYTFPPHRVLNVLAVGFG
jgi:hypothetical protein